MKATDDRSLPKTVKVALRSKNKVPKSPDKLLKWIKDPNPGLHGNHSKILDKQIEPKCQRQILLVDRDSQTAIKGTGIHDFSMNCLSSKIMRENPSMKKGPQ